jgi:hypothetical protein
MTKAAAGTVDAKSSKVIGAQRGLHVVVAAALGTKAAKPARVHFAALVGELALLLAVHGVILDVQEDACV